MEWVSNTRSKSLRVPWLVPRIAEKGMPRQLPARLRWIWPKKRWRMFGCFPSRAARGSAYNNAILSIRGISMLKGGW